MGNNLDEYKENIKLGRSAFVAYRDNKKYLLKHEPSPESLIGVLIRLFFKRSIKFRNEVKVNISLNKYSFNNFNYPKVIETDCESYIVYEYVDGKEGLNSKFINRSNLVYSIIELQTYTFNLSYGFFEKKFIRILRLPYNLFRRILSLFLKRLEFKTAFKSLVILLSSLFKQKKFTKGLYVHNDLLPNNLLNDKSGKFYIIDFENLLYEKKWILIDIVDIAFDVKKLSLDMNLINDYIGKLQLINFDTKLINKYVQVRLILLKRVIQAILSEGIEEQCKHRICYFLNNTLLIKGNYDIWLRNQGDGYV